MRYTDIETDPTNGTFSGTVTSGPFGGAFSARFDLFLIRQAWEDGMDVEDLADGFGEDLGTLGGDWSGIRDSSDWATERMFERALNHLFGEGVVSAPRRPRSVVFPFDDEDPVAVWRAQYENDPTRTEETS